MEKNELINRITIDPQVCHGKPTIRGLRYTVESILEYLAAGDTVADILKEFKDLEEKDIYACLAFATMTMKNKGIIAQPLLS